MQTFIGKVIAFSIAFFVELMAFDNTMAKFQRIDEKTFSLYQMYS
jgi:hypothetical protein